MARFTKTDAFLGDILESGEGRRIAAPEVPALLGRRVTRGGDSEEAWRERDLPPEGAKGAVSQPADSTVTQHFPVLIRIRPGARIESLAPGELQVHSVVGNVVSGECTAAGLAVLDGHSDVLGIEASREGGALALESSVPFIHADRVQRGTPSEDGSKALIAFIDSGIDLLHQAFLDDQGRSRVLEIWDQRTTTRGKSPKDLYGPTGHFPDHGTIHTQQDIDGYLRNRSVPSSLGRDEQTGHGTHVASIAAGRKAGEFAGGVAPGARLIVVIATLRSDAEEPRSIGYSRTHTEALDYIRHASARFQLPVVINVSQGMNAGAHDGSSILETAFDEISSGGRDPGIAIVKSAGNERNQHGHAKLTLASHSADTLRWEYDRYSPGETLIDLWFKACDELRFRLVDPDGALSGSVDWQEPQQSGRFASGNRYSLTYSRYHRDNGDSQLALVVRRGSASQVKQGAWSLELEAGKIRSDGVIHAWVERDNYRPLRFTNHLSEELTLSIPGTARSVITVGAVNANMPMRNTETSSYGPTRDGRDKPDLVAPGTEIVAARAGSSDGVVGMTGTSMAAPHVAGAIALLFSRQKRLGGDLPNAAQVRAAITQLTQSYNGRHTPGQGYGLLDVEALLAAL